MLRVWRRSVLSESKCNFPGHSLTTYTTRRQILVPNMLISSTDIWQELKIGKNCAGLMMMKIAVILVEL